MFAGCAVFAWALRLRLPAAEAACGSPEREAGCLCDDRLAGRRPRHRPVSAGAAARDRGEKGKRKFFWTALIVLTIRIVGNRVMACKMSQ